MTSTSSSAASSGSSSSFRIASWNILAQSYTFSHNASADSLSWPQRGERILDRIRAQDAELLCLQEVDHYLDFFRDRLSQLGYECRYYAARSGQLNDDDDDQTGEYDGTPLAWRDRSSSKRCKMDGLLLAWKKDRFEIDSAAAAAPTAASSSTKPLSQVLCHHIVDFDDLAYAHEELRLLQNNASSGSSSSSNNIAASTQSTQLTKYLRHNIGQFVFLRSLVNPTQKLLLANIHLYWNPMHEEVKLKQVILMMERMEMECKIRNEKNARSTTTSTLDQISDAMSAVQIQSSLASSSTPTSSPSSSYPHLSQYRLILAGDFNSSPASKLYNYITQGVYEYKDDGVGASVGKKNWNSASTAVSSSSSTASSSFNSPIPLSTSSAPQTHTPRFICDRDLIKVAKWLRSIGIDCAHYTEEENKLFSHQGLFTRAVKEHRILITSSFRLIALRGCPPYFHLPSSTSTIEDSFTSLIIHYSLQFQTELFYSRCIFCNSGFQEYPPEYFLGGVDASTGITYEPHPPFADIPPNFVTRGYTEAGGEPVIFRRCRNENSQFAPCGKLFWLGHKSNVAEMKFQGRIEKALAQQQREDVNDGVDGVESGEKKENGNDEKSASSSTSASKPRSITPARLAELQLASSIALRKISLDSTLVPQQSLRLKSAYAAASSSGGDEPEFTNLTTTFYDTLDYIFFRDPATSVPATSTSAASSSLSSATSNSSLRLSSVHPLLESTHLDLPQLVKNGALKASTASAHATTTGVSTSATFADSSSSSSSLVVDAHPSPSLSIVLPNSTWPSDHLLIQATFAM